MTHATAVKPRRTKASPQFMTAVALDRFGPPSVLRPRRMEMPTCGPNEILIAVDTAGVGVWDTEIRGGWWPEGKPKFPIVLGTDGSGIVAARGARVRRFAPGDRVWGYQFLSPKGGFSAEFVAIDARHAARIPNNLDLLHAGAAAVTGLTAFQGIHDHLHVRAGETVLIFGATGAVGSLAVQFAKHQGARVIATARGHDAAAFVRKLGADVALDPGSEGVDEQLDAVLALAGGERLEACLEHVRRGGRVAHPNGVEPVPRRRKNVRVLAYDAEAGPRRFAAMTGVIEACGLQVPLAGVYPLDQAAKAHEHLEEDRVLGRVALKIRR
jgi:NADPH:quinone reductase-like Zn-dependent oxidoreductase